MRMPFGKHKGLELEHIPHDYLAWVLDECDIGDTLARAIEDVLFPLPPPTKVVIVKGFDLEIWMRRLSLEFHPDRGGTKEAMQAINRAYELAKEMNGSA